MTNQTAKAFGYPHSLIHEYEHWLVLLRENQITLGSVILCAKSDAKEFSSLSKSAFTEMSIVTADIERVLGKFVNYEKINYLMLMMVDPHVHFHVVPRYSSSRKFRDLIIADQGWPASPDLGKVLNLNPQESDELCRHIRSLWINTIKLKNED